MWVLIFLIGLLVGMEDRARMWTLGAVFLITSALVYFLFLAAWLNIFLLLGALLWIRLLVGGFALAAGLYYLHEFALHSETYCRVTSVDQRRWIMDKARRIVAEGRFDSALGGIIVLAAAVNLIELLCSAGLPAVFANVLSMSDLPTLAVLRLSDALRMCFPGRRCPDLRHRHVDIAGQWYHGCLLSLFALGRRLRHARDRRSSHIQAGMAFLRLTECRQHRKNGQHLKSDDTTDHCSVSATGPIIPVGRLQDPETWYQLDTARPPGNDPDLRRRLGTALRLRLVGCLAASCTLRGR